jgi:prevent-host-death family protein
MWRTGGPISCLGPGNPEGRISIPPNVIPLDSLLQFDIIIITISIDIRSDKMYKRISALKARQNLGQVMNEVSLKGDDYIIERAGKALVAVIPIEKYQSLQREIGEFFESLSKIRANLRREDEKDMDGLIGEAVQSYRKSKIRSRR